MKKTQTPRIEIQKTSIKRFAAALGEAREQQFARAIQHFLLCKAALCKRREELERQCEMESDYFAQARMIAGLEKSLREHRKTIDLLSTDLSGGDI